MRVPSTLPNIEEGKRGRKIAFTPARSLLRFGSGNFTLAEAENKSAKTCSRREHVFADLFSASASVKFPDPKRRRERAGVKAILRPRFPSSIFGSVEGTRMGWNDGVARPVSLDELGQGYR